MRGRVSSSVRRFAPVGACALLCLALAHCAGNGGIDSRYGVSPSARLVEPGEPVPKGGGVYRVGSPYMVAGRVYVPAEDPQLQRGGARLVVRRGFPWPRHRQWRGIRRQRHHRRASDAAVAELCAGDQFEQWSLAHRARQRSRAVCRQSHHRRLDAGGASARLHQPRHCLGARPICRARADARLRRPRVGVNVARELAGAGAVGYPPRRHPVAAEFPAPAAAGRHQRLASAASDDALDSLGPVQAVSYAETPGGADGTDQFLNGRGLY